MREHASGFMRLLTMALVLWFPGIAPAFAQRASAPPRKLDVPYEPTPQRVVEIMLRLAEVKITDYLIDLGCGDGRIPVTAAERYGVKALCVDLDPARTAEARANAKQARVEDKVEIVEADLFQTDLSKADVLTLYLWPEINLRLRERVLDLKPGTRVVSHEHDMGNWRPDTTRKLGENVVYLWRVPAKIAGQWQFDIDGRTYSVKLQQGYQFFTGSTQVDGRTRYLRDGRINGANLSFSLVVDGLLPRRFTGSLTPDGTLEGRDWRARRAN